MNSDEAARHAGISYRQLDYWCTRGWLGRDHRGVGIGRSRTFTHAEAEHARRMKVLNDIGVTIEVAHAFADMPVGTPINVGDELTLTFHWRQP